MQQSTVGLDKSSFGDGDTADSGRCGDKAVKFAVVDAVGGTNLSASLPPAQLQYSTKALQFASGSGK